MIALLIPILALCIPIVAILAGTYSKTHPDTSPDLRNKINTMEEKIRELENNNQHLENSLRELEDKQNFLTRLIEDKNS